MRYVPRFGPPDRRRGSLLAGLGARLLPASLARARLYVRRTYHDGSAPIIRDDYTRVGSYIYMQWAFRLTGAPAQPLAAIGFALRASLSLRATPRLLRVASWSDDESLLALIVEPDDASKIIRTDEVPAPFSMSIRVCELSF